jgi:hypothetical protein
VNAVLALVLSLAMSPEAARAQRGPLVFGSGPATFLLIGPAGPGDALRLARVRLTHLELASDRSFDDAEYRFSHSGELPASTRAGQQMTGALWRFGPESPEGRKVSDGVRVEFEREERVAPATGRGLAYRAFGTPDRLYLVHAGTGFAQVLRVQPASELEVPPGGLAVRVDRPSQEAATRLLPGETAPVRVGEGRAMRLVAVNEIWFVGAPAH